MQVSYGCARSIPNFDANDRGVLFVFDTFYDESIKGLNCIRNENHVLSVIRLRMLNLKPIDWDSVNLVGLHFQICESFAEL